MAKQNALFNQLFKVTRHAYKVQHAARTFQAWSSGSPKRIAHLYERRLFYKVVARLANKLFHN